MRKTLRWLSMATPLIALLGVGCDGGSDSPPPPVAVLPVISDAALINPSSDTILFDSDRDYTIEFTNDDVVIYTGLHLQISIDDGTLEEVEDDVLLDCGSVPGDLDPGVCGYDDFFTLPLDSQLLPGDATLYFTLLDHTNAVVDEYPGIPVFLTD
jgi:hypothetical protein